MKLGITDIEISEQGLGCMAMSEFYGEPLEKAAAIQLITEAYKAGVNFFDTADMYGFGENEKLIGESISHLLANGVSRETIVIATKCGIVRSKEDPSLRGINNSYDYIISACEASLACLGASVGIIDLFYLHRIADNGDKIEESMRAMAKLLQENKIRAVGLSEASADIIERANRALLEYTDEKHQISAVQSEYSLLTKDIQSNGVLEICRRLGITFIAYSPLSRALLTGEIADTTQLSIGDSRRTLPRFQEENLRLNNRLVQRVKELAEQKSCSTAQIALAWLMAQPGVVPIPGTTKLGNLLSNISARDIRLSEEEMRSLSAMPSASGERYTPAAMKAFQFERSTPNSRIISTIGVMPTTDRRPAQNDLTPMTRETLMKEITQFQFKH